MPGGITKVGGVSRAGFVRMGGPPSAAGQWTPVLNDQTVDFDRDAFTRFVADKGYDVVWEKAVLCPNVPGTGLAPRDHAINCQVCDNGLGFLYVDPIRTKMLMQGVKLNQSFFAYGRWDMGNMLVTAEPEFNITYWDRLTLCNGVSRFTERVARTRDAVDVLKYAPLCVDYLAWVNRDGALVEFENDVDFRTNTDGAIEWIGSAQPDSGSFYSVSYEFRPRYVVMDLIHHHRDSTIDGVHYEFPVQAVAKLDFLIRNQGADAPQVSFSNPFST